MRLHLIASKPTDSVTFGVLPAAARLGLDVIILSDQPEAQKRALARSRSAPRPGPGLGAFAPPPRSRAGRPGPGGGAGWFPANSAENRPEPAVDGASDAPSPLIVECDPWDPRALIARMAALPAPDAVFSNSDHLQAQTALAAAYFGLPGKDWRSALRARDKTLMRRWLAGTGAEHVAAAEITASTRHPVRDLPYPVVLKPAEGVASEDVVLAAGPDDLARHCGRILSRRPGERLIAEEYLAGPLRTLETIGDGVTTWVLGGFRTDVSAPPFFVEERLTWDPAAPPGAREHVLGALAGLGVSFGACHTEYVLVPGAGPRLIEVNDRLIGDHCDFLLTGLLGVDVFELALRVHLGQPLPPGAPPAPPSGRDHAVADYVVADHAGWLAASLASGPHPAAEPGVALAYWPMRRAGDRIALTHANRDYLGVITAIGPGPAAVERSVVVLRRGNHWPVTPHPPASRADTASPDGAVNAGDMVDAEASA